MADVTKITLPDGTTKNIKDSTARSDISLVRTAVVTLEQYGGGINLLNNTREVGTATEQNITIVTNSDKTVTLTRTQTASSNAFITITNSQYLDAGTYVLMGCPVGGSGSSYELRFLTPDGQAYIEDKGSGAEFTLSTGGTITACTIRIDKTYNPSGMTFKPMILRKSDYDRGYRDYQPYALPNTTLTTAVSETYDRCCSKNLLPVSSGSGTRWVDINCDIPAGDLVLSFGSFSSTYTADTYQMGFFDENYQAVTTAATTWMNASTKVLQVTTTATTKILRVYASLTTLTDKVVTFSNAMICSKADWDISHDYVPYNTLDGTTLPMAVKELSDADGQKNIANLTSPESLISINGCTVTVNGTVSSTGGRWLWQGQVETGTYVFAVNFKSGGITTYLYNATDDTTVSTFNTGVSGGNTVSLVAGKTYKIGIYLSTGATITGQMDVMLCTKAQWDISHEYVPYAMSNAELTAFTKGIYTSTSFSTNTTGTYVYTGVSFTVPAHQIYEFIITDQYTGANTNFGTGIILADTDNDINQNSVIVAENNTVNSQTGKSYWVRQIAGMTPHGRSSDKTYYVWVNRGSNTESNICVYLRRIV